MTRTEAARALGIDIGTVTRRYNANPDAYPRGPDGTYWVPSTEGEQPTPVSETPPEVHHDDGGGHGSAYVFDVDRDKYIFALRSKAQAGRPFVVSGETIRATVIAYSRDGSDATVNEICRTNGWHRTTTREIMRALGKTHDSAPFTDEDLSTRAEDELGDDLLRLKEERVLRKAERRSWEQTKSLAEEARHFDRFVARRIAEVVEAGGFVPPARSVLDVSPDAEDSPPFTAIYGLTDLHFGAAGWRDEVGQETTRAIVRTRAIATTRRLIERVLRFGRPRSWLVPAGSDNFHADTDAGTTTKGTPLDTDGSFARMFIEGCALYEELIGLLLCVAPVEVVAMPGNHDRLASMMLTHWLAARYRNDADVKIGSAVEHRSYHLHGKALIGFNHGDSMKDEKLPLLMATEASEKWGASTSRAVFSGHIHTDKVGEYNGVRVIHMPCLATADRWHHRSGYTGNTKAIAAHLVDHNEGLIASLPVQPPPASAP